MTTEFSGALSLGVSIVLYRTHVSKIERLVHEALAQGAERIYLVDNSPLDFPSFEGWVAPERVVINRLGRNVGYGAGHNMAIRESIRLHKYHLISNPDIHLGPGLLPGLHGTLDARPDVGLIMPNVIGLDGERHYLCKRSPSPLDFVPPRLVPRSWYAKRRARFEMRDHSYEREMEPECLSGCFMFFRSSTLEQTGGFDERFFMYLEDFDLCRRARRFGRNLYYPGLQVVHEHRRGHKDSLRLTLAFASSAIKYFNKWGWFEPLASRAGGRYHRP